VREEEKELTRKNDGRAHGQAGALSKIPPAAALVAALLGLFLARPARADDAFATPPSRAAHSSARLLAGGAGPDGAYRAGVEIGLEPNTITYWRSPGEAGSPPVFDFSASENVAAVETLYPAPIHIEEAGSLVAGYDAPVIFPLRVTPRDPKAPVTLDLTLDYAACGKICLPAKAKLSLALPRTGASPHAEAIAAAERRVPRKLAPDEARKMLAIARRGGKDETVWSLRYLGPGKAADLFAEVPEPLYLESQRAADGESFELKLVASCCAAGKPAPAGAAATLTLLTDQGAIEAPARLE
jgi:DsbC/DsbD-like thiol-disulfide interchange protein